MADKIVNHSEEISAALESYRGFFDSLSPDQRAALGSDATPEAVAHLADDALRARMQRASRIITSWHDATIGARWQAQVRRLVTPKSRAEYDAGIQSILSDETIDKDLRKDMRTVHERSLQLQGPLQLTIFELDATLQLANWPAFNAEELRAALASFHKLIVTKGVRFGDEIRRLGAELNAATERAAKRFEALDQAIVVVAALPVSAPQPMPAEPVAGDDGTAWLAAVGGRISRADFQLSQRFLETTLKVLQTLPPARAETYVLRWMQSVASVRESVAATQSEREYVRHLTDFFTQVRGFIHTASAREIASQIGLSANLSWRDFSGNARPADLIFIEAPTGIPPRYLENMIDDVDSHKSIKPEELNNFRHHVKIAIKAMLERIGFFPEGEGHPCFAFYVDAKVVTLDHLLKLGYSTFEHGEILKILGYRVTQLNAWDRRERIAVYREFLHLTGRANSITSFAALDQFFQNIQGQPLFYSASLGSFVALPRYLPGDWTLNDRLYLLENTFSIPKNLRSLGVDLPFEIEGDFSSEKRVNWERLAGLSASELEARITTLARLPDAKRTLPEVVEWRRAAATILAEKKGIFVKSESGVLPADVPDGYVERVDIPPRRTIMPPQDCLNAIVAHAIVRRFGPYFTRTPEAMRYYLSVIHDDVILTHWTSHSEFVRLRSLVSDWEHDTNQARKNIFQFLSWSEINTDSKRSIRGVERLTLKETDAILEKFYQDRHFYDDPEALPRWIASGGLDEWQRLPVGDGLWMHATLRQIIGKGNQLLPKSHKTVSLPDGRSEAEDFHFELIPFAIRQDAKLMNQVIVTALESWVRRNQVTFEYFMKMAREGQEIDRFSAARAADLIDPKPFVLEIPVGDQSYRILVTAKDLFRLKSIAVSRKFWTTEELRFFRQVGLIDKAASSRSDLLEKNDLPFERVNQDEFLELTSDILYALGKTESLTIESIRNALQRRVFVEIDVESSEVMKRIYRQMIESGAMDAKRFSMLSADYDKMRAGHFRVDAHQFFKRLVPYFLAEQRGLADVIEVEVLEERVSATDMARFICDSILDDSGYDLTDTADVARMIADSNLEDLLLAAGDSPISLKSILAVFAPELVKRYGMLALVRGLRLYVKDTVGLDRLPSASARAKKLDAAIRRYESKGQHFSDLQVMRLSHVMRRILTTWVQEDARAVDAWLDQVLAARKNPDDGISKMYANEKRHVHSYTQEFQTPARITSTLKPYQKEGVVEILQPQRPGLILGDEQGLGKSLQAIAAAEAIGAKRVLWVTTNGNKQTIYEEILKHTNHSASDVIIVPGTREKRAEALRNLDGKQYVIIHYEALRKLQKQDPEGYRNLTQDIDLMVIDEAQNVDNRFSQQGDALQKIPAKKRLLLTATPYKHSIKKMWNILQLVDPGIFNSGSRAEFMRMISSGPEGLEELHDLISPYIVRRLKSDLYGTPDPNRPIEEQVNTLPVQIDVPYQVEGGYMLTKSEMEQAIAILTDETMSPLARLGALDLLMVMSQGRREEAKRILKKEILAGHKVLLWAHRKDVITMLQGLLAEISDELKNERPDLFPEGFGYARFDGSNAAREMVAYQGDEMMQRDVDRNRFMGEKEPRVMITSLMAGAEGLTFSAASVAVYFEMPNNSHARFLQAHGRNHRVDGKFLRYDQRYYMLIGQYMPRILSQLRDEGLRRLLANGSFDEIKMTRQNNFRDDFRMVMDGLGNDEEVSASLSRALRELVAKSVTISYRLGDPALYAEVDDQVQMLRMTQLRLQGLASGQNVPNVVAIYRDSLWEVVYQDLGYASLGALVQESLAVVDDGVSARMLIEGSLKRAYELSQVGRDLQHELETTGVNTSAAAAKWALPVLLAMPNSQSMQNVKGVCAKLCVLSELQQRKMRLALQILSEFSDETRQAFWSLDLAKTWENHTEDFLLAVCLLRNDPEQLIQLTQMPADQRHQSLVEMGWKHIQFVFSLPVSVHLRKAFADDPTALLMMQNQISPGSESFNELQLLLARYANDHSPKPQLKEKVSPAILEPIQTWHHPMRVSNEPEIQSLTRNARRSQEIHAWAEAAVHFLVASGNDLEAHLFRKVNLIGSMLDRQVYLADLQNDLDQIRSASVSEEKLKQMRNRYGFDASDPAEVLLMRSALQTLQPFFNVFELFACGEYGSLLREQLQAILSQAKRSRHPGGAFQDLTNMLLQECDVEQTAAATECDVSIANDPASFLALPQFWGLDVRGWKGLISTLRAADSWMLKSRDASGVVQHAILRVGQTGYGRPVYHLESFHASNGLQHAHAMTRAISERARLSSIHPQITTNAHLTSVMGSRAVVHSITTQQKRFDLSCRQMRPNTSSLGLVANSRQSSQQMRKIRSAYQTRLTRR